MATIEVFGMSMTVIAELPDGFKLAAHNGGPVITDGGLICVLEHASDLPPLPELRYPSEAPESDDMGLPEKIRYAAVEAYRKWSWPIMAKYLESEAGREQR